MTQRSFGRFHFCEVGMKQIPLTQGKFALVDDEDFEELSQHKWFASKDRQTYYAVRNINRSGKYLLERMHRRILDAQSSQQVDHINHNGLDNQRKNIRLCTDLENSHNMQKFPGGSSKYKGVCWSEQSRRWSAKINISNRRVYLGLFANEDDAARAYDIKARELYGEFAYLNFPHGPFTEDTPVQAKVETKRRKK
jgi:hypothetical protein